MQWSTFVGHLLSFDSAVIPQRKPKEETIVRPAGFTSSLSSMDVPRVGIAAKKRKRRIIIIALGALGLLVATIAISRLKPAVPSIDRSTVWVDTVKRGPMTRVLRRKCLAQGPFTSKDVGPFSRREGLFQIKRPHSIKLQHNGPIQYKNSKHAKLHEAIAAIPMAMTASA